MVKTQLEMAGNGRKWLEWLVWLELTEMAGNGWNALEWLEMATHVLKQLTNSRLAEMFKKGWKWLEQVGMAEKGLEMGGH